MPSKRILMLQVDGPALVAVGELDLSVVDDFLAAARERLAAGDLLLDLRELTFMDSSGVRALDALVREAEAAGRSLRIRPGLQPEVVTVLRMTGLLDVLPITDQEASG